MVADTSSSSSSSGGGGLVLTTTDALRSFLKSTDPQLSYKSLKTIWLEADPNTRPDLSVLLSGSNFLFSSPKPREKSEELKARLRKLEEVAERKAYDELVKDITPRKPVQEPFSAYKDQLGLGLHVVVTMFTGYLLGYAAFRALFSRSPAMTAAGGILGLVGGMLVETLLFIIKASNQDARHPSSTSKTKKNQ